MRTHKIKANTKRVFSFSILSLLSISCANMSNLKLDKPSKDTKIFNVSWSKNLDPIHDAGNLPIGTSSPLIYEDMVFMGNLSGEMNAYDLETGRVNWTANEKQAIGAQAIMFGKQVIYGSLHGRVFSRHYLTGKVKYSIDLGAPVESSPVVNDGRMYLHLRNHKIVALDASTGKVIWSYKRSVPFITTLQRVSRVLPYKNKLIVGFADGNLVALSKEEGIVLWEQRLSNAVKFIDVDVDPVYFAGYIVAGSANGELRFLNPENGLIMKSINIIAGHSPVKVGDHLIVGSVFGDMVSVDRNGKIVDKIKLSKNGISSIIPWNNGLAVATMGGKLFHVNKRSFKTIEDFDLGSDQSAVFGFLQVSDNNLAVYSSRNRLYIFKSRL